LKQGHLSDRHPRSNEMKNNEIYSAFVYRLAGEFVFTKNTIKLDLVFLVFWLVKCRTIRLSHGIFARFCFGPMLRIFGFLFSVLWFIFNIFPQSV